jgi:NAD(P)-dependent dehydrogenase (short-subunit alcohol dehydrogenase family)
MAAAVSSRTIVLVSGGNSGIGFEVVKKLASENPSYQVLMGCGDTDEGEAAVASLGAPSNVNPVQLDVTDDVSILHCFKTIEQYFGRLDVLINSAETAGRDFPARHDLRQLYTLCYNVNVIGAALLTEAMIPLLEKSKLPKIIMISSRLGSIARVLDPENTEIVPAPFYSASKAAMNYLAAYYARKYADRGFKVNACCPGLNASGLNYVELTEEMNLSNGAITAVRLATEGPEGASGTYTDKEGPIPW